MEGLPVPVVLHTERLLLRRWGEADAASLAAALAASVAHLADWIPRRVSAPGSEPELAARLSGFAADFDAGVEWRYAMFRQGDAAVLGEISLFPRDAGGRVPYAMADRLEIGYWLSAGATGRGYATEAARALLGLAGTLPGMRRVEIRCDARNVASAAVPRRLGFQLAAHGGQGDDIDTGPASGQLLFTHELDRAPAPPQLPE